MSLSKKLQQAFDTQLEEWLREQNDHQATAKSLLEQALTTPLKPVYMDSEHVCEYPNTSDMHECLSCGKHFKDFGSITSHFMDKAHPDCKSLAQKPLLIKKEQAKMYTEKKNMPEEKLEEKYNTKEDDPVLSPSFSSFVTNKLGWIIRDEILKPVYMHMCIYMFLKKYLQNKKKKMRRKIKKKYQANYHNNKQV
ncbi:hypothetical protein RFI_17895, partial [Reticulomyxa filosa]